MAGPHRRFSFALALTLFLATASCSLQAATTYFEVAAGSGPHDVAADPAADGPVYYTAQHTGKLGILDPRSGKVEEIPLGKGSAPHGVIVGPDRAAWITDSGLNAIVRVDARSRAVEFWPLPATAANANLNTAAFDGAGRLWFTGQSGYYGRFDPATKALQVWAAPGGRGAYGIASTPDGQIYYASLAGNHIAHVDPESGKATVIAPPTPGQGARRIWSDSRGRLWVSYWNTGHVGCYDPVKKTWREWPLPGKARTYSVWVDEKDKVWLAEWTRNALIRFDPVSERFTAFPSDRPDARVRQMLGRTGEIWGAESANDRLVRIATDF